MAIEFGKIFIRSLVGIISASVVTILVGADLDTTTMGAFYGAILGYIYMDKDVSNDVPKI